MMNPPVQKQNNLKQKGNSYYKQGQYAMACAMYRKYVAKNHQDNKNAYYNMSLCLYKLQKYEQCIQACMSALKLDEDYIKVYYRLALAYQMLNKDYYCFIYADVFCNKTQNLQSVDYKQMKQLRNKMRDKIMYPSPIPIQQKHKIFYEKYEQQLKQNKQNKNQEVAYFKGYSWLDVQKDIDNNQLRLALDKAYSICRKSKNEKFQQINNKNLQTVKSIKAGNLSKETKLIIQTVQVSKQIETAKPADAVSSQNMTTQLNNNSKTSVNQIKQQKVKQTQNQNLSNYQKYFVKSLQKKLDIFEGFPSVITSILQNKAMSKQQIQDILMKASKQYQMFMVLQMSLSDSQKLQIKKQMNSSKISKNLIDIYCA